MPRETKKTRPYAPPARFYTRAGALVCAVSVCAMGYAMGPVVGSVQALPDISFVSLAYAQQLPDAATQELFLAVDRNDLGGVRAAIDKGADVEARDYTGTQPVDMAIDRGYFDIAHYLISVRNAKQAQNSGQPALPVPSAEELARSQSPFAAPTPAPVPQQPVPEPQIEDLQQTDNANPFEMVDVPMDEPMDAPVGAPVAEPTSEAVLTADEPPASLDTAEPDPFVVTTPSESLPVPGELPVLDELPVPQAPSAPYKGLAQAEVEPPAPAIEVVTSEPPKPEPAKEQVTAEKMAEKAAKPSAAKTFITTFLDFFKPPNITGVTRREEDRRLNDGSVSDAELAKQLQQIAAERGDAVIKGPEVPISPEELARQLPPAPDLGELTPEEVAALGTDTPDLPPYSVGSPQTTSEPMPSLEDAFGDLLIDDATLQDEQPLEGATPDAATRPLDPASIPPAPSFKEAPGVPGKRYDPTKPFGGGVDPDVLAWLDLDPRTALAADGVKRDGPQGAPDAQIAAADDDPFASPFESLDGAEEPAVSDLLEGLDEPQDVARKDPKSPPSPDDPFAASDDPFAALPDDVDELAGLLESTSEDVQGTKGWDVTKVEGADLPSEMVMLSEIEPTGEILDGVELALGANTVIGQEVGEDRIKLLDQETIHKPCISKGGTETVFCIDTISWPFELEESFLVDTIMYQGTRAVARYDAGRATNFHSLFRTEAFENVISYYTNRYGQPTEMIERAIAPLAAPRQGNPTYLWQSREPGTDTVTTLEIRKFDDALPGFPDTLRGALLLYRSHAKPIFPQLSQLELMVLKADAAVPVESTAPTPGDVWN